MNSPDPMARVRAVGATAGLLLSLGLHGLALLLASWLGAAPDIGIELQLPDEVEFGIADAPEVGEPPPVPNEPEAAQVEQAAAEPDEPAEPDQPELAEAVDDPEPVDAGLEPPDAGTDAGLDPPDAGLLAEADAGPTTPDAGLLAEADAGPTTPDAGLLAEADAGPGELGAPDAGPPLLAATAPEGAQLALRLHMGRVRASPLAADVRALLEVVPDWQALLAGSGIDAIEDLERLYLASPNLKRASLVVAGQYRGDESLPRRAVASLAQAKGVEARWRTRGGLQVAPWENRDPTARIVALLGPQLFAITRPDDLPRILQVAEALSLRLQAADAGAGAVEAGDALLALHDGETIALSVEGARAFVAGARPDQRGVPARLEVSVAEGGDGAIAVLARGLYDDPDEAQEARALWARALEQVASHPAVAFIGMRRPLTDATLEVEDAWLVGRSTLTRQQARVLLGFVRNALTPPTAPPPTTAPDAPPRPRPRPPLPAPTKSPAPGASP